MAVAVGGQRCGTHRRLDASLSEHAGRVPELDALARKFLVAKQDVKEQLHEGVWRCIRGLKAVQAAVCKPT